ncbi:uncharacterized protein A4U43_C08F26680 [Asparagus officinalis]|nr:uncharacterized protein A4U43_C08F26680 [Asparagus officinalis]
MGPEGPSSPSSLFSIPPGLSSHSTSASSRPGFGPLNLHSIKPKRGKESDIYRLKAKGEERDDGLALRNKESTVGGPEPVGSLSHDDANAQPLQRHRRRKAGDPAADNPVADDHHLLLLRH